MSGNRFHNKFHRHNHHTSLTSGDIDSTNDPIASASDPFLGDFNLSGDLVIVGGNGITATDLDLDSAEIDSLSADSIGSVAGSGITLIDDLDLNGNSLLNFPLSGCDDVTITAPTNNGEVLTYNAGTWENSAVAVVDGSVTFAKIDSNIWTGTGITTETDKVAVDFATSGEMVAATAGDKTVSPSGMSDAGIIKEISVVGVTGESTHGVTIPVNTTNREYDIDNFSYSGAITIPWQDVTSITVRLTTGMIANTDAVFSATVPGLTPSTMEEVFYSYIWANNNDANRQERLNVEIDIANGQQLFRVTTDDRCSAVIKRVKYVERYGA